MPKTNEYTPLLTKISHRLAYFPDPPPAPRPDTVYAVWKDFNCIPSNLFLWKQHSLKSIRWSATTYDTAMCPAHWYDLFVFKICCCGDANNCDCGGAFTVFSMLCNVPKTPCCICSGICACGAGVVGGCYDVVQACASSGPRREVMEDDLPYSSNEHVESKCTARPTTRRKKGISFAKVHQYDQWLETIDKLLASDDLPKVMDFFSNPLNIELMQKDLRLYKKKVFIICLVIRYPKEDIHLDARKLLLVRLLDPTVIHGYYFATGNWLSPEGWMPAPLVEAIRSNYRHSAELLEVLCQMGANIRQFNGWLGGEDFFALSDETIELSLENLKSISTNCDDCSLIVKKGDNYFIYLNNQNSIIPFDGKGCDLTMVERANLMPKRVEYSESNNDLYKAISLQISGIQIGYMPGFLQLWVYYELLFKQHQTDLFYKALILKHYERSNNDDSRFQRCLQRYPFLAELDHRLDELCERKTDRTLQCNTIVSTLHSHSIPDEVVSIIGQYYGIFAPVVVKMSSRLDDHPNVESLTAHSSLFAPPKIKDCQFWYRSFFSKYKKLPPVMELEPFPESRSSTGDYALFKGI